MSNPYTVLFLCTGSSAKPIRAVMILNAANESYPVWPIQPITAHWNIPDPAAVEGTDAEKYRTFGAVYRMLHNQILIFVSLPITMIGTFCLRKAPRRNRPYACAENRLNTRTHNLPRCISIEALETALLVAPFAPIMGRIAGTILAHAFSWAVCACAPLLGAWRTKALAR